MADDHAATKGDYISLPLSDEGRRVADAWTPAMDGSCKAYGAGGVMWLPTRLRISWDGDRVLKVETDAGQQTRLLGFDATRAAGSRSLQGFSVAAWEPIGGRPYARNGTRAGTPAPDGTLKVVTTNLSEGWLRRNGAPYSESTTLTEYWDRVAFPNGDDFLAVTIVLDDPKYLTGEYTRSAHFKREPDASKWRPSAVPRRLRSWSHANDPTASAVTGPGCRAACRRRCARRGRPPHRPWSTSPVRGRWPTTKSS